jgi:hypothetical protein
MKMLFHILNVSTRAFSFRIWSRASNKSNTFEGIKLLPTDLLSIAKFQNPFNPLLLATS